MPPLTGDFRILDEWQRRLAELASSPAQVELSQKVAEAALELVAEDFSGEHGPFGGRWAPKKRPDGRAIGVGRTGQLAKYRIRHVDGVSFRISSDAPYATFFQGGTKRMRPRQIVPNRGRLPAEWRSAFQKIWGTHCRLILQRGSR